MTVHIPETDNLSPQFDMKEAVMSTLQDSECERIVHSVKTMALIRSWKLQIQDSS